MGSLGSRSHSTRLGGREVVVDAVQTEEPLAVWGEGGRVAAAIGLLYAGGFIVSNAHYARYELVRFDLVRGRYVAAALLMLAVAAFPAGIAGKIFHNRSWRKLHGSTEKDRLREWLGPMPMTIWVLTVAITVALGLLLTQAWVGEAWRASLWIFVVASCLYGAMLGRFAAENRSRTPHLPALDVRRYGLTFVMFWYALAFQFGRGVYPYLSPAIGGGAATIGRVTVTGGAVPEGLHAELEQRVAILDRDGDVLNVLVCDDTTPPHALAVSLRSSDVVSVTTEGLVGAPDAAAVLCGGAPVSRKP